MKAKEGKSSSINQSVWFLSFVEQAGNNLAPDAERSWAKSKRINNEL